MIIWLTGLPGAGKTTIAYKVKELLAAQGVESEILDGDEIRKKISADLGFSPEDRATHNRRVIDMAKRLSEDRVVLVSLISPYRSVRNLARETLSPRFAEVYVKCPLEVCMERDPKGLYAKAVRGEVKNLTGYSDVYEDPSEPELIVHTDRETVEESAGKVLSLIQPSQPKSVPR
jgi:adenylylsulfate kinase